MTLLAAAALMLALAALLAGARSAQVARWLLVGAALALGAALLVNPLFWPRFPAVVALAVLGLASRPGRRLGWTGWLPVVLLLGLAAALAQAFAVPRLPAPAGPYAVGTVTHTIARPTASGARPLFLKVWYPTRDTEGEPEGLWSDLAEMKDIPWYLRWGLAYLSRVPTHSHRGAAYAGDARRVRLVLYNHSFVSWASETSLLAEDLASRGYTVIAVRHLGQVQEYDRLDRAGDDVRMATEIVRRRVADGRLVADRLDAVLQAIPQMTGRPPPAYAAMGFSLGGAVSTDLCLEDPRCRAVVNIDGAIPGVDFTHLPRPYLMIYGAARAGEGALRTSGYEQRVFARAVHADFHDSALALPVTRWVFGRTAGELRQERRQQADLIAAFLARVGA